MDASKGKEVVPNIAGRNYFHKGKGSCLPTADDGNLKVNIIMQRERQRKMKDMFRTLHEFMSHVPGKVSLLYDIGQS
nr:unnamed protein product [Digitaria exilis]